MSVCLKTLQEFVRDAWTFGLYFQDAQVDVHTQAGDLLKKAIDPLTGEARYCVNIETSGPDKGGQLIMVDGIVQEKSRRKIPAFVVTINEDREETDIMVEVYSQRHFNIKLPQHRTKASDFPYLPKEMTYTDGQQAWWGIELFRAIDILTDGNPHQLKISSHYADALAVVATAEEVCRVVYGKGFFHAHFPHSTGYRKLDDETEQAQRTLHEKVRSLLGTAPLATDLDFTHYVKTRLPGGYAGQEELYRDIFTPAFDDHHHKRMTETLAALKASWATAVTAALCAKAGLTPAHPTAQQLHRILAASKDALTLANELAMGHRLLRESRTDAADVVIAQSDTMYHQRKALPHLHLYTIPNAVNTLLFQPAQTSREDVRRDLERRTGLADGWLSGGPLIVGGGRFETRKGLVDLAQAVARVQNDFPGTRLVLFGNNTDPASQSQNEAQIIQAITALTETFPGFRDRVVFLGKQPQQLLSKLFYAADICAFPNREEPDGLVVKEALATTSGQQVVIATTTTNAAVQMNVLVGKTVCVTANPNDPDSLAVTITDCLRHFPERARDALTGGEYIHLHLGFTPFVSRILDTMAYLETKPRSPQKAEAIHAQARATGLYDLIARNPEQIANILCRPPLYTEGPAPAILTPAQRQEKFAPVLSIPLNHAAMADAAALFCLTRYGGEFQDRSGRKPGSPAA